MTQHLSYRPEVDGLRAVAVISVMLFHAHHTWLPGGFVGVDVFFVISGYLITSIIHREITAGTFTLAGFYERRIRRILPALFLVIAVSIPVALVLLTPGQLKDFGQSIVATAVFSSNIYFYLKTGYFSPNAEELPLLHTWSLAVEEQYYIFFPLLLMAIARWAPRSLWPVLVGLVVASFAAALYLGTRDAMANFFLLPSRGWELLAGALLALGYGRVQQAFAALPVLRLLTELAGLAAVGWSIWMLDGTEIFPGWHAVPVVAGTVFLMAAMTPTSPVGRVMSTRLVVGLGLVSYSAYLWHQPILAFLRILVPNPSDPVLIAALVATFGLAWISWRFVEAPFRNRRWLSQRRILSGGAVAIVVFSALGVAGHVTRGLPDRYDPGTLALAATMTPSPRRDECHTDGLDYLSPARACTYGEGPASWAVLGDSHGVEIAHELGRALAPRGRSVRHLTFSACPPALSFASRNPGCNAWFEDALRFLETDADTRNVLITYRYAQHLYGTDAAASQAPVFLRTGDPAAARQAYWDDLRTATERLRAAGKNVVVMGPFPELPMHVERYVFARSRDTGPVDAASMPRAAYDARVAGIVPHLKEMDVPVILPADALCRADFCAIIDAGRALYFDDNHLSLTGAERVMSQIVASGLLDADEGT